MISRQTKVVLFGSAVLCCALASNSYAMDNVLATVHLTDGTIMQFTEAASGGLVVVATTPAYNEKGEATTEIGDVPFTVFDTLDPVEQYERLSKKPAPPALVEAQERAERAMSEGPAATTLNKVPIKVAPEYDAGTFQRLYCPTSGYSFNFCWLDRTGNGYVQRARACYIQSTLNPVRGNVSHRLEYYGDGYWHTQISWTVLQDYVGWIWWRGPCIGRRATIYEGEGDHYHVAIFGNE